MSLAQEFAAMGQSATSDFEEADCIHLATGKSFRAKIQPIEDRSLNEIYGIDPRATDFFQIADKSFKPNVNDVVSAIGAKWMLVKGAAPDNPASLHLKHPAICGVKGKDSWA